MFCFSMRSTAEFLSMKLLIPLAFVAVLLFSPACKPMPNDGVPFFLQVDTVYVVDSTGTDTLTHRITDIWAETKSTTLGAFERPCNIPVLEEGAVSMILTPGIYQSGQSGVRVNYPFYAPDTFTLQAERGQSYKRTPVFHYIKATKVAFFDNFEIGNNFTGMGISNDSAHYGTRCGIITVTAADSNKVAVQTTSVTLPAGQEIWLEVDYKSDVPFWVGYQGHFPGSAVVSTYQVLFVNARSSWNKLYVKLSESVAASLASTYNIYFEALRPYGSTGGTVYIDNVKLLHL